MGSDHLPCITKIDLPFQALPSQTSKPFIPKKINSTALNKKLSASSNQLLTFPSPENYSIFIKIIQVATTVTHPTLNTLHHPLVWWNDICDKAISDRRLALQKYSRDPSDNNFRNLKAHERKTTNILKKQKKLGFHKFCSNISPELTPSQMWEQIRIFRGIRKKQQCLVPPDDLATLWAGPFGPHHKILPISLPPRPSTSQPNSLIKSISLKELQYSLDAKRDTAPGPDLIRYTLINSLSQENKLILLHFYNLFLEKSEIPEQWLQVNIAPILKPGKNPHFASSYRPHFSN